MKENVNEILKGIYDDLTDEQKEKAKECKTMDELMSLAGEWGIELPDEALDAVSGGGSDCIKIFFGSGSSGGGC